MYISYKEYLFFLTITPLRINHEYIHKIERIYNPTFFISVFLFRLTISVVGLRSQSTTHLYATQVRRYKVWLGIKGGKMGFPWWGNGENKVKNFSLDINCLHRSISSANENKDEFIRNPNLYFINHYANCNSLSRIKNNS